MQVKSDFIEPRPNPFLIGLAKLFLPLVLHQQQLKVIASARSVSLIKRYANLNAVIVANHSDRCDSLAVAALSKHSGQDFHFLAAREVFDKNGGIIGWIMQRCGVYSVIRGEPEDLDSKTETIALIVEAERPLIEFPEGDVTGTDGIAPLKADGIQNMFEAQRILMETDYIPKSVTVLPIAIYYSMSNDAVYALDERIRNMDEKLGLHYQMSSIQVRILRLVSTVVDQLECTFGTLAPTSHLNARLRHIIRHVVTTIGHLHGFKSADATSMSESQMLYSVRALVRRLKSQPWADNVFAQKLLGNNADKSEELLGPMQDLAILENSLRQDEFDPLLAFRLVERLELIINGKVSPKGMRTAVIDAGEPIRLIDYWTEFEESPERAIDLVAHKIKMSIKETRMNLMERHEPERAKNFLFSGVK